jgi:hypothetical protein
MKINNKSLVTRESNFELLRIIGMASIVFCHIVQGGIGTDFGTNGYTNGSLIETLSIFLFPDFGVIGNAIFFLIAGFFVAKRGSVNVKRLYKVITPVIFYTLIFIVIDIVIGQYDSISLMVGNPISFVGFLISGGNLWFIIGYIAMNLVFTPFVKVLMRTSFRFDLVLTISFIIFAFSLMLINEFADGFVDGLFSFSISWMIEYAIPYIWVFLFGMFVYKWTIKNPVALPISKNKFFIGTVSLFVLLHIFTFCIRLLFYDKYLTNGLTDLYNPLFAIVIFIFVKNMKITSPRMNSNIIKIGGCSFGIYILHFCAGSPIHLFYIDFISPQLRPHPELYFLFLFEALLIYMVCLVIELLRQSAVRKIRLKLIKNQN